MKTVSSIMLNGHKRHKQHARELLAVGYDPRLRSKGNEALLKGIAHITVGSLDRKIKHGEHLTFEEAFCGMCHVVAATNAAFRAEFMSLFESGCGGTFPQERSIALASAFLNLMAAKESFKHLTEQEVAGMVSAAMMDSVIQIDMPRTIETCGMGGDKGYGAGALRKKGINASTLSSLVLAALGLPSIKHGSYGNTSAVGSTEAIESFGAFTSMESLEDVTRIIQDAGYCFFDAHWCKTIHDLSHLLMMETVNHVIGPMTPPLSPATEVNKLMGVNEKVHPQTIAQAYAILHQRKIQKVGGVVVVAGLGPHPEIIHPGDYAGVRAHTILDEVSPYSSIVSITYGSVFRGSYRLTPQEFGVDISPQDIQVENLEETIRVANMSALDGSSPVLADYLAMNAALGLFAYDYAGADDAIVDGALNGNYLRQCFARCREAIASGAAAEVLKRYVRVSTLQPASLVS